MFIFYSLEFKVWTNVGIELPVKPSFCFNSSPWGLVFPTLLSLPLWTGTRIQPRKLHTLWFCVLFLCLSFLTWMSSEDWDGVGLGTGLLANRPALCGSLSTPFPPSGCQKRESEKTKFQHYNCGMLGLFLFFKLRSSEWLSAASVPASRKLIVPFGALMGYTGKCSMECFSVLDPEVY